jgi:hypothetical protein
MILLELLVRLVSMLLRALWWLLELILVPSWWSRFDTDGDSRRSSDSFFDRWDNARNYKKLERERMERARVKGKKFGW